MNMNGRKSSIVIVFRRILQSRIRKKKNQLNYSMQNAVVAACNIASMRIAWAYRDKKLFLNPTTYYILDVHFNLIRLIDKYS